MECPPNKPKANIDGVEVMTKIGTLEKKKLTNASIPLQALSLLLVTGGGGVCVFIYVHVCAG